MRAGVKPVRQPNRELRRQRQLRGWSLDDITEELAKLAAKDGEMGPDRNTYGRWERGIRRPQPRNVRLLCRLFDLPADELELIEEEEPPSPALPPTHEPSGAGQTIDQPPSDQPSVEFVDSDEMRRRQAMKFLLAAGVSTSIDSALSTPIRVLKALDIVTSDDADTLRVATDCLNELIAYYSERLAVSPPADLYDDLVNVRWYASTMLKSKSAARQRSDLVVAAGWLSNLLAVATSYMGDHGTALVWCVDAQRRADEAGHPELAGWAVLAKAMMAYYQGRAARSIELACLGQEVAPRGTVVHAKLAAQEMRARAMLGDADGVARAKRHATKAIAALPSTVATTGVFSIALSEEPPYTATSLLLVDRFHEAASITRSLIQNAYPTGAQNRNRQSSSYARTLLILALAEAGLGRVDEAAAAGRVALDSTGPVWPTLVLAAKLDQALMRGDKDAKQASEYHALYLDAAQRTSTQIPPHSSALVLTEPR